MENPFNCNSSLSSIAIKDAIFSKMQQSKAILTCVMFATEFVRDDMRLGNACQIIQCFMGSRPLSGRAWPAV